MTSPAYLSLLAPTVAEVACAGQVHRLRWDAGTLTALDHDDPDGERALAALGGARNGCVDVLDAWARRRHDLRVLTLGSRGPADPLRWQEPGGLGRAPGRPRLRPAAGWGGFVAMATHVAGGPPMPAPPGGPGRPPTSPGGDPGEDYPTLFSLGGGLPARLVATAAAHWADRLDAGEAGDVDRPALQAALTGRVWQAVRAWTGDQDADAEVAMAEPSAPPRLSRRPRLLLELPFHWLSRVWVPGLAVIAGRLALDATRRQDTVELVTVDPDGRTGTVSVTL